MADTIRVELVGTLSPAPGDVVVCRTGEALADNDLKAVLDSLGSQFPDNLVAVVPPGWSLEKVPYRDWVAAKMAGSPILEPDGSVTPGDVPVVVEANP